jgi:ATP-dependent Clp protease adaptor protein ClpS
MSVASMLAGDDRASPGLAYSEVNHTDKSHSRHEMRGRGGGAPGFTGSDVWFRPGPGQWNTIGGRWQLVSVAPVEITRAETDEEALVDKPWLTIVWNDPVNLMDYVTYVFQRVFGYPKPKAERLMLDVHHKGKAVVAAGAREAMERNAETLHGYGLWATVSHDT